MDVSDILHFNNRLRQERIGRNWRQQDLANQLGTTAVTVRRWERGNQRPSAYFRIKLCALFGKSAEELGLGAVNSLPSPHPERDVSEEIPICSSLTGRLTLWTVPYRRNPYFTGRNDLLQLLDHHLSGVRQGEEVTTIGYAALTQPQAMKGLGGIGKTQIAVEYAYRAREQDQYTHTLWINAASQEALISSFTALAAVLPAFPAKNEPNQQKLVEAIKQWLEQCQERWFLIFDNADDLSLIQEYVPQQGNGSILLTTRANAVGSLATSIDVEKMGFVEGTHLLLRRAQRYTHASDEEVNEAGNIVVALDHFPLALEQAGAYIEETGCSFGNYLQLYQTHRKTLLVRRGVQSTNYPDSVATTWSLSFQKIEQSHAAAAELLRLCAFLAPNHIPEELLTNGTQYWPPALQQATTDPFTFNLMLEALLAFSLVKRFAETHLLSIHRLVQAVQMDRMGSDEQRQWAERVVSAVNVIFPRDPKNEILTWPQCLRYLEQAQACNTLIKKWELILPGGADLLNRTGIYLYEHASYALAEPLFQYALRIWDQDEEPEHARMASPLYNLATLYRVQGKYIEAESLFQRTLYILEQTVGSDHVDAAIALKGLATLYREQGRYIEAEPLYQRVLHLLEQTVEPEHPEVASLLSNLATLYRIQGKYVEAEPLYHRALHLLEQTVGPEHPEVASLLHSLATLYQSQGKYAEAEFAYQRALPIWEQMVGFEHLKVASLLNGLGTVYLKQGKYAKAESAYQRALHISEQTMGPKHPQVASLLNNLGELYREQGKYAEAEPLYQRTLPIWEQTVGPKHPYMASSLGGLAALYFMQGSYAEAESLFQRALSIYEHALAPYHPDIAETLHNLAALREAQGNIEEAISLYRRALEIREKVYGQQHPKTTDTRECLHTVSVALSRMEETAALNTRQSE